MYCVDIWVLLFALHFGIKKFNAKVSESDSVYESMPSIQISIGNGSECECPDHMNRVALYLILVY